MIVYVCISFCALQGRDAGSVEEQTAKYSLCVTVRAKLSQTTSLLWPCLVIEGENKEWNYMFIFENNFNLLSPHFGKKQHPQGHSKPRSAVGRPFQLFIHLMDVCKPERDSQQLTTSVRCRNTELKYGKIRKEKGISVVYFWVKM